MIHVHRFSRGFIVVAAMAIACGFSGHVHADAPPGRYTIANGTVLDSKTGLLWQQAGDVGGNWDDAKAYCAGLSLDGKTGWRLPSMKELQTIVDESRTMPAIDTNAFPNIQNNFFWTSSPSPSWSSNAWIVYFYFGGGGDVSNVSETYGVRCVR